MWTANVPRTADGEWDAFCKELSNDEVDATARVDENSGVHLAPFHDIQPLADKRGRFFDVGDLESTISAPYPLGEMSDGNIFTALGWKRRKDVAFQESLINVEGTVFRCAPGQDYFTVGELFRIMGKVSHSQCDTSDTVFVGLQLSDDGERYTVECMSL